MNDTRGQPLEVGQIVDIQLIGMFRGTVIAVNQNSLAIPGSQPMPPHVIVDIQVPRFIQGSQDLQCIYIVRSTSKSDPVPVDIHKPS